MLNKLACLFQRRLGSNCLWLIYWNRKHASFINRGWFPYWQSCFLRDVHLYEIRYVQKYLFLASPACRGRFITVRRLCNLDNECPHLRNPLGRAYGKLCFTLVPCKQHYWLWFNDNRCITVMRRVCFKSHPEITQWLNMQPFQEKQDLCKYNIRVQIICTAGENFVLIFSFEQVAHSINQSANLLYRYRCQDNVTNRWRL